MKSTNLRTDSESGGLAVVGHPVTIAQVSAGHRLVMVDGDRYLTLHAGSLYCDGHSLCNVPGTLLGVHKVGAFIVVAGTQGVVYLVDHGGTLVEADVSAALPMLSIVWYRTTPTASRAA